MTLTIELKPAEEARLQAAARDKGIEPEELARQLIATLPLDAAQEEIDRHQGLDELVAEAQKLGMY